MTFLIDGYNLLHAVGWATPRMRAGALEAARGKLIDWLATSPAHTTGAGRFRVVFDAQRGSAPSLEQNRRGVWVRYAYRRTADDEIEDLLDAESNPKQVTVVSNDMRLHESARHAGARGWGCEAFLDWLIQVERRTPGAPQYQPPEKPDGPASSDELDALLRAFEVPKPRRRT
ncbi:NYN domain-containing protein [Fimbriiglobus ruber]|uniref:YacP-like NYN domain protein n=1 Tax=Fimbriiglobus ruber TaxID=1908690 RepID=A0A225DNE8_9BACT|nr:NYN domain-containing protein [Fimbriiglobus ruber]OWK37855.1 hypothetical protein FRUB_06975 [Fimbriiglobus ruber]